MRAKKLKKSPDQTRASKPHNPRLPFAAHLLELRKRLFYVAASVIVWAIGAYFVQQKIVAILLRPAQNQQFIYTSVGGGIDFLLRVCMYAGIVCSIPVIVFQVLKYLEPLIKKNALRFMAGGAAISGALAIAGMAFGYFLGLPAALHFLLHQFTTDQIHPLLTIQSYMSFVSLYMLGSALLFQLPLILVLINRIKPLKPKKLLGYERWVVLLAFVLGGIMNPSPRVQDQLMLAMPIIIAYQVGILLVWRANRHGRSERILAMLQKDAELQAQRHARFQEAQAALQQKRSLQPPPVAATLPLATAITLAAQPSPAAATSARPTAVSAAAAASVSPMHHVAPAPNPAAGRAGQQASLRPRAARRAYFNDFRPRRVTQTPLGRPQPTPQSDTFSSPETA